MPCACLEQLAVSFTPNEEDRADGEHDNCCNSNHDDIPGWVGEYRWVTRSIVCAANEVDGITQRRDVADDVEVPRQVADWIERTCQEELRQEDEWEEQVCRSLIRQHAHDQSAERRAKECDQDERWDDCEHLRQGERDAEHDTESHDGEGLWEGDERLAKDLAGENRSSTDWSDEDLLAEVVLAILKDGDKTERRRLPDSLGKLPSKDEWEQINARRLKV